MGSGIGRLSPCVRAPVGWLRRIQVTGAGIRGARVSAVEGLPTGGKEEKTRDYAGEAKNRLLHADRSVASCYATGGADPHTVHKRSPHCVPAVSLQQVDRTDAAGG